MQHHHLPGISYISYRFLTHVSSTQHLAFLLEYQTTMNTMMIRSLIKGTLQQSEKIKYLRISAELEKTCVTFGKQ